jgi:peptidoglycan/LPS O-acetylase OafA/YrhL
LELNYELSKAHRAMAVFYIALIGLFGAYFVVMDPANFWEGISVAAIILGTLGAVHFVASKGAEASQWWGRAISVLLGTILLVGFPIGTAIGGYLLYLSLAAWEHPERKST